MDKRAIIVHGTGGHPDHCWYRWLGARLAARDYVVEIPHYPGLNRDPIETFLPTVLASHVFDRGTVLVGHSGGAALLLSVLEHIDVRWRRPFSSPAMRLRPTVTTSPCCRPPTTGRRSRRTSATSYFVNSVRDPYGCDAEQGRRMFDKLGGTQIIRDEGHFGDMDDPYPTFELLDRLID